MIVKILISILQIAEPVVPEQKPKIGIKPLQFLTGCFLIICTLFEQIILIKMPFILLYPNMHFIIIFVTCVYFMIFIIVIADPEAVAKSEMSDDCGGGKMKIDDLIIIPNNINHAEEGGSALQVNKSTSS